MEEGDIANFGEGPRTDASTENVYRPITDLQIGQILIGIYCCRRGKNGPFFSGPAASTFQGMLVKLSRKKSKN